MHALKKTKKKKSLSHMMHIPLCTPKISVMLNCDHGFYWRKKKKKKENSFFVIKSSTLLTDIFLDRYTMLEKRIQIGQVANMNAVQSHHLDSQLCDNFN